MTLTAQSNEAEEWALTNQLLTVQKQLALLQKQAKARRANLPAGQNTVRARLLVQHLAEAQSEVRYALGTIAR